MLITELPDEVDETSHSMYDEVVEKLKGNKKRLKKLRARMATRYCMYNCMYCTPHSQTCIVMQCVIQLYCDDQGKICDGLDDCGQSL